MQSQRIQRQFNFIKIIRSFPAHTCFTPFCDNAADRSRPRRDVISTNVRSFVRPVSDANRTKSIKTTILAGRGLQFQYPNTSSLEIRLASLRLILDYRNPCAPALILFRVRSCFSAGPWRRCFRSLFMCFGYYSQSVYLCSQHYACQSLLFTVSTRLSCMRLSSFL